MIEVKLDSATAIHYFRPHSIGVLANQKAGESGDGLFIDEKCVFGRPPAGEGEAMPESPMPTPAAAILKREQREQKELVSRTANRDMHVV